MTGGTADDARRAMALSLVEDAPAEDAQEWLRQVRRKRVSRGDGS